MRAALWAIVAVAVWALAVHLQHGPAPLPADAPAGAFSASRARIVLARVLGPQRPHPAGSEENGAVHARLLKELSALGVAATSLTRMSCYTPRQGRSIVCGTVTDIIADVVPGSGKAVVLMAHLDSVPAGPGAADDGVGVATLLETIRALKAGPAPRRPVIALFTDGEEFGMLGAAAFVREPVWRARAGVTVNVDARGNEGQSLLFQTSPGDAGLIDLYARNVPHPAAGSLYAEIYKFLPNDTDLTPFLEAGVPGYNFANIGHVAAYHTAIDALANLDDRTLQSHGDNVLAMTRALTEADFEKLKSGNAIYLDVMGLWLPRLGQGWALPLSLLTLATIALGYWLRRGRLIALAMPPALLLGAAASGFLLQKIAAGISGQSDPAYAHPMILRLALALGVWSVTLWCARRASLEASWLWLAILAAAAAWFLPGASPYFLFPALVAALILPFAGRRPWLATLPALAVLLIWLPLAAEVETLLGLATPLPFVLILAVALIALLPLLRVSGGAKWTALLALAASVGAGFVTPFDDAHPQRLNLTYAENQGKANYLAATAGRLPDSLRAAAKFSAAPSAGLYDAPAGQPQFPQPVAKVARDGFDITLDVQGSDSDAVTLTVPAEARLATVSVNGVTTPAPGGRVAFSCLTPDCAHARIRLVVKNSGPFQLLLTARRFGLPAKAALVRARPGWAVPSQFGDLTILTTQLKIPAG